MVRAIFVNQENTEDNFFRNNVVLLGFYLHMLFSLICFKVVSPL